jgi:hypothetical protein
VTTDGRKFNAKYQIAMCEGKDKLTPEQARKVAQRMQRKDRIVEAFRCNFCNDWHVGRPIGIGKRRRQ